MSFSREQVISHPPIRKEREREIRWRQSFCWLGVVGYVLYVASFRSNLFLEKEEDGGKL